jgi:hypothetical protein
MRALNMEKPRENGAKTTGDSPTGDSPNILARCTTLPPNFGVLTEGKNDSTAEVPVCRFQGLRVGNVAL